MDESGNRLSVEGGSVRFVAARNIRFGHRPRDSRLRGNDGCLLLKLISVGLPASPKNGLHRGVRGMALSIVENPINYNRRQPE